MKRRAFIAKSVNRDFALKILLLHQNFPGQYAHIASWAKATPGVEVAAITDAKNARPDVVKTLRYKVQGELPDKMAGPVRRFGEAIMRAEGAAKAALAYKNMGYKPDLILGHAAWGETFYMREVFPDAKVVAYAEFYYRSKGLNTGFDSEFDASGPDIIRTIDSQNAVMQMAMLTCDHGYCPTLFQASTFPTILQPNIGVVFDGVDTDLIKPDDQATFTLPNGKTLKAGDDVITFINRNFEPYRGYHTFMRTLPKILKDNPNAQVIMVGGEGVSYGPAAPKGSSWKDIFLKEVADQIDVSRVHFLGRVPHEILRKLYQISAAHVYLTYPFVLSWSMLEAMAAGCLVIGSDVEPVREMISPGHNGVLVPFFDRDALSDAVSHALQNKSDYSQMRSVARQFVIDNYDLKSKCLPTQLSLYRRIVDGDGLGDLGADKLLQQKAQRTVT
jgi:glycosyltransferase involved in cell wall biosynthesis